MRKAGTIRWKRLEITGGFLLLAAVLYYFDTQNLLVLAFVGGVLHELGHLCAIYLLGGRVSKLRLSCVGAEIVLSPRRQLAHWKQIIIALAGPAANLAVIYFCIPFSGRGSELASLCIGVNVTLCIFNLLPIAQLDGGRILWYALNLFLPEETTSRVVGVVSVCFSLALAVGGAALLVLRVGSWTLLLTALWLVAASVRRKTEQRRFTSA
ncbi:MAG: site-2 protease family protein [Oscillospiraceae bacterium]|nr:site-2 protease family protein [Oscillospiraceae bacterium]